MGERLRENLRTTGHRNLQDELTNTLVRSTLREIRGWYDRYVDAAHALIDPQNLEKELRTLNLDLSPPTTGQAAHRRLQHRTTAAAPRGTADPRRSSVPSSTPPWPSPSHRTRNRRRPRMTFALMASGTTPPSTNPRSSHARKPPAALPARRQQPWQDPAGPGSTRRLIEFSFQCPLCDGVHTPQFYFTLPTPDLEAYAQAMDAFMKGPYALDTALRVARQTHDSDGDLADLITRLPGRTVAMGILNHRILEESEYTCDFCGQTFSTIAELRIHLGVEPHTAPDQDNVQPRCQSRSN